MKEIPRSEVLDYFSPVSAVGFLAKFSLPHYNINSLSVSWIESLFQYLTYRLSPAESIPFSSQVTYKRD